METNACDFARFSRRAAVSERVSVARPWTPLLYRAFCRFPAGPRITPQPSVAAPPSSALRENILSIPLSAVLPS